MDDTLEQTLSAESDAAKAPSSPLAEQVFDTLRAGIVSGDFPPGARLRIRDLAEKVGTSVMPVREAVKRHVDTGVALLDELGGFSADVHDLVRSHHERLDGTGYPHGLRGAQIPLGVRVLAVCDVYDALLSTRVYRAAWTHERAIVLLRQGSGVQFDELCVDALERVLARERTDVLGIAV